MKRFFDIDNPIMRGLTKIFDVMALGILWLVFSLPVFTMGAASAALYLTVYKYLRRGEGYLWRTFWNGFCDNLRRSTLAWLAALLVFAILAADVIFLRPLAEGGGAFLILYWAALILTLLWAAWTVYLAAYSARFNGSVGEVLKFSFMLFRAHPAKALRVILTVLAGAIVILLLPALVIFIPATVYWLSSKPIEDTFKLHMRPEDVEKEEAARADTGEDE